MYPKLILAGVLKRIGSFGLGSFEERLLLQKRIYLLQAFRLYLGYKFSWYIHGPYSPDLTRDAYQIEPLYEQIPQIAFANGRTEKRFNDYVEFLDSRKSDADWLEQLACTHFLKAIYPEKEREEIIRMIIGHERHFQASQCESAYDYLVEHSLL